MLNTRPKKESKQAFRVTPNRAPLDQIIFDGMHESAMRDAIVLFYNQPLLEMQKRQGLLPKRAKSLKSIYEALLRKAFETRRTQLALPKAASKLDICHAVAKHLN